MNHHEGLVISVGADAGKVDVDATYVELGTETYSAVALTADLDAAGNGAGKLDTGSADVSKWYFVWAIGNVDGDVPSYPIAAMLSLSATAPTMPTGYTEKLLIGQVYNDATGALLRWYHIGKWWWFNEDTGLGVFRLVYNGAATTFTALTAFVPSTAKAIKYRVWTSGGSAGGTLLRPTGSNWVDSADNIRHYSSGGANPIVVPGEIILGTNQQIDYKNWIASRTTHIFEEAYSVLYS